MTFPQHEERELNLGIEAFREESMRLAKKLLKDLEALSWKLLTCESMSGGKLAALITEVPGASRTFLGGFVTYSYDLKERLGVSRELLRTHGAVSEAVAEEMSLRALDYLMGSGMAISITGNAGPTAQEGKPVGSFFIGIALREGGEVRSFSFRGEGRSNGRDPLLLRRFNRELAVNLALRKALYLLRGLGFSERGSEKSSERRREERSL